MAMVNCTRRVLETIHIETKLIRKSSFSFFVQGEREPGLDDSKSRIVNHHSELMYLIQRYMTYYIGFLMTKEVQL